MKEEKGKVLFFIVRTPQESNQLLGGSISNLLILKHLKKYRPIVVVNKEDLLLEEIKKEKIDFKILEGNFPFDTSIKSRIVRCGKATFEILKYNIKFFLFLRKQKDIKIVQCDEGGSFMVFLGTKLANRNLIIYIRNSFKNNKIRFIYKILFYSANRIITINKELKKMVQEQCKLLKKDKVTHIYNGIDMEEIERFCNKTTIEEAKEILGLDNCRINIGVIGAIEPLKRQLEFIKECILPNNWSNETFYFIGGIKNEAYYNEVKKIIIDNHLSDSIKLIEYTSQIFYWYRGLDIIVLPSEREGVPRTLIEAQAFGLPVIGFDTIGVRESLKNNISGFLVSNFQELTEKLKLLIRDKRLRIEMGEAGKQYVKEYFDIFKNNIALENIYDNLLR